MSKLKFEVNEFLFLQSMGHQILIFYWPFKWIYCIGLQKINKEMVNLGFTIQTKGSIEKVFEYFSNFANLHEWDLNVTASKPVKQTPNKIGSTFLVTSVFNGKASDLTYEMFDYQKNKRVYLQAQNGMIKATDELLFEAKGSGTVIRYNADISLRHIFWLFTPCIKGDLLELAAKAEQGMKKKCQELFG